MAELPLQAQNYALACYAVSLAQGETLRGSLICSRTLRNYIKSALSFWKRRGLPSPNGATYNYIELIIKTMEKFENIDKRQYMIYDSMLEWLDSYCASLPRDSAERAALDWIKLGLYTGFHRSEWCQTTLSNYDRVEELAHKPARAIIASDLTLLGKHQRKFTNASGITRDQVEHLKIKFRHQKNGDHGEENIYSKDVTQPTYCPANLGWTILDRAERLGVPAHEPIAVFKDNSGRRRFITDSIVKALLRKAAQAVFNMKPSDPELLRWTSHSIRVTAANILHRQNFSDSFIQKRLRWKSTTFLMYLRNTIYHAAAHKLRISDCNLPPEADRQYRSAEPHESFMTAAAA